MRLKLCMCEEAFVLHWNRNVHQRRPPSVEDNCLLWYKYEFYTGLLDAVIELDLQNFSIEISGS